MSVPTDRVRPAVPRWAIVAASALLLLMLAGVGGLVHQAQERAAAAVESRFRLRAEIAERFLRAYVEDILRRERAIAEAELHEPVLREQDFVRVVQAFGFEAAVLLDGAGRLELVYPPQPAIIGKELASSYVHLQRALVEGSYVSSVVPSAALGVPVVAFATRYATPHGPRVISGAYDAAHTPLRAYISNLTPVHTSTIDLIDAEGAFVTSSRSARDHGQRLADVDPRLARAIRADMNGEYVGERGPRLFTTQPIKGTSWKLVAAVDVDALYGPARGRSNWIDWLLYSAFCLALSTAAYLFWRLLESRVALRAMNKDLERLARVDRLTGLPNRLHVEEQLVRMRSAARRQQQPLSVFVTDVDHFKSINDTYGHLCGDEVLSTLGQRMVAVLRVEDMLGRWGGEEFLCVLPNTGDGVVTKVAERARAAVSQSPIVLSTGQSVRVTVSIGCATLNRAANDDPVRRADDALYRAKQLGRDRVVSSDPPEHDGSLPAAEPAPAQQPGARATNRSRA